MTSDAPILVDAGKASIRIAVWAYASLRTGRRRLGLNIQTTFLFFVVKSGVNGSACRVATNALPLAWERIRRSAQAELAASLPSRLSKLRPVIGSFAELPADHALAASAPLDPKGASGADAFIATVRGETLYLLGATPRGAMNAVFAVQDAVAAGEDFSEGWKCQGAFQFKQRIFHARFQSWPGERPDVRFIAHLGASHCLVAHDWQGNHRSLQGYVTSPLFPDAVEAAEVAQNHAQLRRLLNDCADYGLGAMLWLTELPCQGGPWVPAEMRTRFLTRFPGDVLSDSGTYEGKVLCFSHPRVQEFYRDLIRRFFTDFPEIETLFVFGQDSGGEFCDPDSCPRCRGLSRIAQRDRLLGFLIEEGQKVRPGLRVLTTGWHWDREPEEFLRRQAALPSSSGVYFAAQNDGWQCERQTHDFMTAVRAVCRDRGQDFIGYDNFHWGDDTVHGLGDIQDYPLGIAAKLRRWQALGVDGVFDHWGNAPDEIWSNSIACREFFLDPRADAVEVCRRIARRQFGERAGELTLSAWRALERAQARLSDACTWSPGQWPMWYAGRAATPIPAKESLDELRRSRNPPRTAGDRVFNPPDFSVALQSVADAWHDALPHYIEAARLLDEAEAAAADGPLFYRHWWNGPRATPTRTEHLRRQRRYVESMAAVGCEIGIQFELYALWERLGGDPVSYRVQARGRLHADAAACRDAADYFAKLGQPKDWPGLYATKAQRIEQFLAEGLK